MSDTQTSRISGIDKLVAWFGRVPRFHDAKLLSIDLRSGVPSTMRIHAWQVTDRIDEKGYFILEKDAVVTLSMEDVTFISLNDFNLPGIIYEMTFADTGEDVQIAWTGSYGVDGTLKVKRLQIDLGKP